MAAISTSSSSSSPSDAHCRVERAKRDQTQVELGNALAASRAQTWPLSSAEDLVARQQDLVDQRTDIEYDIEQLQTELKSTDAELQAVASQLASLQQRSRDQSRSREIEARAREEDKAIERCQQFWARYPACKNLDEEGYDMTLSVDLPTVPLDQIVVVPAGSTGDYYCYSAATLAASFIDQLVHLRPASRLATWATDEVKKSPDTPLLLDLRDPYKFVHGPSYDALSKASLKAFLETAFRSGALGPNAGMWFEALSQLIAQPGVRLDPRVVASFPPEVKAAYATVAEQKALPDIVRQTDRVLQRLELFDLQRKKATAAARGAVLSVPEEDRLRVLQSEIRPPVRADERDALAAERRALNDAQTKVTADMRRLWELLYKRVVNDPVKNLRLDIATSAIV